jgi:carbonic anhydrase/acetyltransferase-like protein (isoleucine patch superfamily)
VLEDTIVEVNSIYAGVQAKRVKTVDSTRGEVFERTAKNYKLYAGWFKK